MAKATVANCIAGGVSAGRGEQKRVVPAGSAAAKGRVSLGDRLDRGWLGTKELESVRSEGFPSCAGESSRREINEEACRKPVRKTKRGDEDGEVATSAARFDSSPNSTASKANG